MTIDGRTTTDADRTEPNVAMWRDEIEAFGRQAANQLQSILANLDALQRSSRRYPAAVPTSITAPSTSPVRTTAGPTDLTPRSSDPDNSEDRLANLKKMLAAKLSQSSAGNGVDD